MQTTITDTVARVLRAAPDVVADPYGLFAQVREYSLVLHAPAFGPAPACASSETAASTGLRALRD